MTAPVDLTQKREAALRVMSLLESGLPTFYEWQKADFARCNAKLESLLTQAHGAGRRPPLLLRWLGVPLRVLRYVLCVKLFRIDREFIDLGLVDYLRKRRAQDEEGFRVTWKQDSKFMCFFRVLDGLVAMLPDVRRTIETCDDAMLRFHDIFYRMAHTTGHPWAAIFECFEGMGVEMRYTARDRDRGFPPEQRRCTFDWMIHVYVRHALEGLPVPEDNGLHWKDTAPA